MKHLFSLGILLLILYTSNLINPLYGQELSKWSIGLGFNGVDIRAPNHLNQQESVATVAEDYLKLFDDTNLNLGSLRLVAARYLKHGFSLQLSASVNTIKKDYFYYTLQRTTNEQFMALDAKLLYDLNELLGPTAWFDPYLLAGGGYTKQAERSGALYALGYGCKLWFSDQWALNLQSDYNGNSQGKNISYFQHSIGFIYQFSERAKASWQQD